MTKKDIIKTIRSYDMKDIAYRTNDSFAKAVAEAADMLERRDNALNLKCMSLFDAITGLINSSIELTDALKGEVINEANS